MKQEIWISPSDLSYFWSDSKIGFYDKYVLKIQRPKQAFPSVFNKIDLAMKDAFDEKASEKIATGAPKGKIIHNEVFVQSTTIDIGKFKVGFKGKIDCLIETNENKYYITDYKTTNISDKLKEVYFLQLMAYAFCLEKPLRGEPKEIVGSGLIVFEPSRELFVYKPGKDQASLGGKLEWVDVPFDKDRFKTWIKSELAPLLNGNREDIFESSSDKSWFDYVSCFNVFETPEENTTE